MIYFVENNTETLASFIAKVMHNKRMTSYDVQLRSGNEINQSYVVKLKNGEHSNVSTGKLKALAKGLGVPEEEIFAIARGTQVKKSVVLDERFENLSLKFSGLPPTKKEKLEALIELMDREIDRAADEN